MVQLRVISLFAGIGGFDLGFERAGMKIVAHVEKHPQCRKLLAAKWPDAIALDDVCTAGKHNLPPCDVICGGFPCQDVSIAGKRAGLKTEAGITRSGLFYQLTRIADELKPALIVWENVPGLLSSDNGRDFARVLIELGRIGYCGAWTTVDAQYYGVAQSRRRVFGVFARGDIGAERCAEILSLQEGLRGHPAPCRKAREGVARSVARSLGIGGNLRHREDQDTLIQDSVCGTLAASGAGTDRPAGQGNELDFCIPEVSRTVSCNNARGGIPGNDGLDGTLIPQSAAHCQTARTRWVGGLTGRTPIQAELSRCLCGKQQRQDSETETFIPIGGGFDAVAFGGDVARTLSAQHDSSPCVDRGMDVIAIRESGQGFWMGDDKAGTLRAEGENRPSRPSNVVGQVQWTSGGGKVHNPTAQALRSGAEHNYQFAQVGMQVRRLTVTECERLQGFPDGWTAGFADGPRYRMLGNAVCVPCAEWIGKRIVMELGRIQEGK